MNFDNMKYFKIPAPLLNRVIEFIMRAEPRNMTGSDVILLFTDLQKLEEIKEQKPDDKSKS